MRPIPFLRQHQWAIFTLLIVGFALVAQGTPATWASPAAQPNRNTVIVPTPTPTPPRPPPVAPSGPIIIIPPDAHVAPGQPVVVVVVVTNTSDVPMQNTTVTITAPPCVDLEVTGVDVGDVSGIPIVWGIGTLAPGQQVELELEAVLCAEMLPDECYEVNAVLTWDGGGPIEQISYLCGPSAILPVTGE
jgi:hypothetical protein